MRHKNLILLLIALLLITLSSADLAFADKASVSIESPQNAVADAEIPIKITVTHSADNFFHYVNWVYVMVNGREVARWNYSWNKRPDGAIFTKEITYRIQGPVNIKAEANCNIHGSKGPAVVNVSVK